MGPGPPGRRGKAGGLDPRVCGGEEGLGARTPGSEGEGRGSGPPGLREEEGLRAWTPASDGGGASVCTSRPGPRTHPASCSCPGPSLSSVLNELPSAATLRYRGPGVLPWGSEEAEDEEAWRSMQTSADAALQEQPEPGASRELPWPMLARRAHR